MSIYRVLVTGSRGCDDPMAIGTALVQAVARAGDRFVLVVHGDCPTGADMLARRWVRRMQGQGWDVDHEAHPAQGHPTEDFGPWPNAGPKRNAYMVGLGADECLAFIGGCTSPRCTKAGPHPSHGATGCAVLAEAAGIRVRRWTF